MSKLMYFDVYFSKKVIFVVEYIQCIKRQNTGYISEFQLAIDSYKHGIENAQNKLFLKYEEQFERNSIEINSQTLKGF